MPMLCFKNSGPDLTMDDLKQAALDIGTALPLSLQSFYLKQNGGVPSLDSWQDVDGELYEIARFMWLYNSDPDQKGLMETYQMLKQKSLIDTTFVPFAKTWGSSVYCVSMDNQVHVCHFDAWDDGLSAEENQLNSRESLDVTFNDFLKELVSFSADS